CLMAVDYRKLQKHASITYLIRQGCSREILMKAALRYAITRTLPGDHRKGLDRAHFSYKQIKSLIASAGSLEQALQRIQREPLLVVANEIPQSEVLYWRKDLKQIARFLKSIEPYRPDTNNVAGALAMHVERQAKKRHLPEVLKL